MFLQNKTHQKTCSGHRFRVLAGLALQLAMGRLVVGAPNPPPEFQFSVVRVRSVAGVALPNVGVPLLKKERGRLIFSDSGVTYKSQNGKTSIELPYADIREADVSEPRKVRLETYNILKSNPFENRSYEFRLGESHGSDLAQFLSEHLKRPVIGAYDLSGADRFTVPAYHRHVFGGAHGVLEIGPDGIQFKAEAKGDSRTWLYRDIQTLGSSGPFNFRVSTESETYTFDLKERLSARAYDLAWSKVYRLSPIPAHPNDSEVHAGGRIGELQDGQGLTFWGYPDDYSRD